MVPQWRSLFPSEYLVHLAVRMCVTLICAVIIVLRPSAQLGGPYLFLMLDVKVYSFLSRRVLRAKFGLGTSIPSVH